MSMRRANRFLPFAEQSNVGPETVDQLHDELRRLAHAYCTDPLFEVFSDLDALQDLVFRLLEGRQHPRQTRDLWFMAAVSSGMLAGATGDLGHPHAAISHGRTAFVCADNAGHEALKMWARCVQSKTAYWAGWTTDALRYCESAAALAPVAGTVSAWLPALEARAHAALGSADAADEAIRRADEARDSVTPDDLDEIGGDLTFVRPRQLFYVAETYARLPEQTDAAEQAALVAIGAYEASDGWERAYGAENIARADLALARARSGNIEGVREALRPVLGLPPHLYGLPILQALGRVRGALTTPAFSGSGAARDLIAEIEHFDRLSQPPALPA